MDESVKEAIDLVQHTPKISERKREYIPHLFFCSPADNNTADAISRFFSGVPRTRVWYTMLSRAGGARASSSQTIVCLLKTLKPLAAFLSTRDLINFRHADFVQT